MNEEYDTTIFITTHDMAEADELCDRIAIMDEGKITVSGPPSDLKGSIGDEVISIKLSRSMKLPEIPEEFGVLFHQDNELVQIHTADVETSMPHIINYLADHDVPIASVTTSRPTLDDVFM